MGLGLLIGFLLTSLNAPITVPAIASAPLGQAAGPANQALIPAGHSIPDHPDPQAGQNDDSGPRQVAASRASLRGVQTLKRLLPTAKAVTSEALRTTGLRFSVPEAQIQEAVGRISSANRVLLDKRLNDSAMVDGSLPSEIRIGPLCAESLVSDDEAVFILAHELTHVGNSGGELQVLARRISGEARSNACVMATSRQEEDLTCDFIAEVALRNFVVARPTAKPAEERLCLALAGGNSGDRSHLSDAQTLRALIGLDPQLRLLLLNWLWGRPANDYPLAGSTIVE